MDRVDRSYSFGARVRVFAADMKTDLGPGTYVGNVATELGLTPRIVLDSGKEIYGFQCWWYGCPAVPKPEKPFAFTSTRKHQIFVGFEHNFTVAPRSRLSKGEKVEIVCFKLRVHKNKSLLFAQLDRKGDDMREMFYLLVRTLVFPAAEKAA